MHSKAEEDAKKAQQIHYDGILQEAESRAVYQGIGYGVGGSLASMC